MNKNHHKFKGTLKIKYRIPLDFKESLQNLKVLSSWDHIQKYNLLQFILHLIYPTFLPKNKFLTQNARKKKYLSKGKQRNIYTEIPREDGKIFINDCIEK